MGLKKNVGLKNYNIYVNIFVGVMIKNLVMWGLCKEFFNV